MIEEKIVNPYLNLTIIQDDYDERILFPDPEIKVKPISSVGYNPVFDAFDSVKCVCPICLAANRGKELSLYCDKITQCPCCGINLDWTEYKEKCKKLGI